ncbi:hypothetical protein EG328_009474 [Venturia inaequalis]|uniref:Uncharacterized protein n=1 Tax=Venturia inaequalis TaxID=5025 RepID=A0A8H3Z2Y4_VENIN|nr:hypothetical protein EG328_009474 [Venturia inaequalis]
MKLRNKKARQARKPDASTSASSSSATSTTTFQPHNTLEWKPSQKLHDGPSFLDLSQELREMIYEEALVAHHDMMGPPPEWDGGPPYQSLEWIDPAFKGVRNGKKWVNHIPGIPNPSIRSAMWLSKMNSRPRVPALLAACRQVHAEAAPIMYGKNRFNLRILSKPCSTGRIKRGGIFSTYGHLVRTISVRFDFAVYSQENWNVDSFRPFMAKVHTDVLPLCRHLTRLEWTLPSLRDGWFGEAFWKKWHPLWTENREANSEARFQLLHESLLRLKPNDGNFPPSLRLNINTNNGHLWPKLKVQRDHPNWGHNQLYKSNSPYLVVQREMMALKRELMAVFQMMKESDCGFPTFDAFGEAVAATLEPEPLSEPESDSDEG